jgi:hypothetical protein
MTKTKLITAKTKPIKKKRESKKYKLNEKMVQARSIIKIL